VLESDQVAEHIPGCNMAFRREALESINGFDPQYRKAGDDVDVCWRLQDAGKWITFAPGAFVWHHRRQGPQAYLRQQAGYGEAEALLRFKHPDKFNGRGDGKWRGVMYGPASQGLRLSGPIIYHGTFASGLFQCLYQPAPAHWAMLPTTLEWHFVIALIPLLAVFWPWAWLAVIGMLACSMLATGVQAAQARLVAKYDSIASRVVVALLCYAQPLVRSWYRYRTRLVSARAPDRHALIERRKIKPIPWMGRQTLSLWTTTGRDRTELLAAAIRAFNNSRWGMLLDSGWSKWDLQVDSHPATVVQIQTVQENHGSGKQLIRCRFQLRPRPLIAPLCCTLFLASTIITATVSSWMGVLLLAYAAFLLLHWWRARHIGGRIVGLFEQVAHDLDFTNCTARPGTRPARE
jgi:hypothetical protein